MALTKFNADAYIKGFEETRDEWLKALAKNPNHTEAAWYVASINAKLELLRILKGSS